MDANLLRVYGAGYRFTDLITGQMLTAEQPLRLEPYQCVWLEPSSPTKVTGEPSERGTSYPSEMLTEDQDRKIPWFPSV